MTDDVSANLERIANRAALKYAVQRQIFDPYTGVVLDVRRAVLFTVTLADGTTGSKVVSADVWDKVSGDLSAKLDAIGATLGDVIDGRVVNGRPRRTKKTGETS